MTIFSSLCWNNSRSFSTSFSSSLTQLLFCFRSVVVEVNGWRCGGLRSLLDAEIQQVSQGDKFPGYVLGGRQKRRRWTRATRSQAARSKSRTIYRQNRMCLLDSLHVALRLLGLLLFKLFHPPRAFVCQPEAAEKISIYLRYLSCEEL